MMSVAKSSDSVHSSNRILNILTSRIRLLFLRIRNSRQAQMNDTVSDDISILLNYSEILLEGLEHSVVVVNMVIDDTGGGVG